MATKKAPTKKAAAAAPETTIVSFKGFDSNMQCRGFQFEVGKTYEHEGVVQACESGFHACEYPLHVLRYYKPSTSVFAVVEQGGTLSRHDDDSKVASSRLTVTAQIDLAGLIKAAIKYTMGRCTPAIGGSSDKPNTVVKAEGKNESATASGYHGAATASGDYGAATASGRNGKARGKDGCVLFIVHRDSEWRITHAKALIVGRDGVKADTFYALNESGAHVEVSQ